MQRKTSSSSTGSVRRVTPDEAYSHSLVRAPAAARVRVSVNWGVVSCRAEPSFEDVMDQAAGGSIDMSDGEHASRACVTYSCSGPVRHDHRAGREGARRGPFERAHMYVIVTPRSGGTNRLQRPGAHGQQPARSCHALRRTCNVRPASKSCTAGAATGPTVEPQQRHARQRQQDAVRAADGRLCNGRHHASGG